MSSAGDLIQASLERLGAYAPGQTMTAADSNRGLDQLNKLLDSLSNESLICYAVAETSFVMTPGKTQYSIGTTGTPDINTTRPLRLREGRGVAYSQDANGNNYPIDVIPMTQWNQLGNRSSLSQSDVPTLLFYDPQFPLGYINLYPTPTVSNRVYFDALLQLVQMTNLTQQFSLPPGYELMLELALAEKLWPFFKSSEVSPSLRQDARMAKRNVKRTNQRNDWAELDAALQSQPGYYNVYTDSYRPS